MPNFYAFIGPQKGHPLNLNKSESPTPKHCFLSSLVAIGLVVLEKILSNLVQQFLRRFFKHFPIYYYVKV